MFNVSMRDLKSAFRDAHEVLAKLNAFMDTKNFTSNTLFPLFVPFYLHNNESQKNDSIFLALGFVTNTQLRQ